MKRMDRLMAIIIALQQGPETAKSLAEKFEVSRRTILRDMQSLSEMGIPLYAAAGPSGGFRLMDGFVLPPVQFNALEALTLLFALQGMTRYSDTPFNRERWTVMDKIKNIIPKETLAQIETLLETLEMDVPRRNYKVPHLSALLDYASQSKGLAVYYRSQNHQRWLKILPTRIYSAHGFWYCEAYSHTHGEMRTFRVDRFDEIGELSLVEEAMLASAMQSKRMIDSNSDEDSDVRIRAKLTYKGLLQVEWDEHIGEQVRPIGDDEWEVEFQCPASELEWAVRFFYSIGPDAEVLEPASIRKEICRLADQVSRQYQ